MEIMTLARQGTLTFLSSTSSVDTISAPFEGLTFLTKAMGIFEYHGFVAVVADHVSMESSTTCEHDGEHVFEL